MLVINITAGNITVLFYLLVRRLLTSKTCSYVRCRGTCVWLTVSKQDANECYCSLKHICGLVN